MNVKEYLNLCFALDTLEQLTKEQLIECVRDADAMIREPGNGVAEYRRALADELNRRQHMAYVTACERDERPY